MKIILQNSIVNFASDTASKIVVVDFQFELPSYKCQSQSTTTIYLNIFF